MRCCLSAASSSGLPRWAGACADSVHAEMPINTLLSLQGAVSSMPVSGTVISFLDDNMSDIFFKVRDLVVNLGIRLVLDIGMHRKTWCTTESLSRYGERRATLPLNSPES